MINYYILLLLFCIIMFMTMTYSCFFISSDYKNSGLSIDELTERVIETNESIKVFNKVQKLLEKKPELVSNTTIFDSYNVF